MTLFQRCLLLSALLMASSSGCEASQVKEPAVAGAFYSADAEELKKSVDRYLSAVQPTASELQPMSIVVPHAGHLYSGAVAAHGYARLKGRNITTVILLGPSHRVPLTGAAIYPGDGMSTPLGTLSVNKRLARSFASDAAHIRLDATPFEQEHSLEVQLPFIQRTIGQKVDIVPILVGNPDQESYNSLTAAIAQTLKNDPNILLVISTDLSHYHDQTTAQVLDSRVIDSIERLSQKELERLLASKRGEMCGGWPVLYGLAATRAAGASHAVLYKSATSGDVNGDRKSVVGYASLGIVRGTLSDSQKQKILELAKSTVNCHVKGEKLPATTGNDPLLKADRAVFVTINTPDGRLRGCIGTILPQNSLQESVIQNAVSAASRDPRFPPVRPEELPGLHIEVTVLSPLEPIADVSGIVIGKHGLYLEKDRHSSVFLPQVPVEQKWDLQTYLAELAMKAGLRPDGWKNARLSVFTAEVIR